MRAPTSVRWMNDSEWEIVTGVFNSSTLPFKQRIFMTDAAGADNRAFCIPTSLVTSLPGVLASAFAGGVVAGPAGAALASAIASAASWLGSVVNFGYIMCVGEKPYPDMSKSYPGLLVHETTHAWQGKNSTLALSYVFASAISQCMGDAYGYTAGKPWGEYNPEQQASIVEDWYEAGESGSHTLYPYIRDYVRKGKVS
jgi:hypothetical protein